jgi:hypothetical protein
MLRVALGRSRPGKESDWNVKLSNLEFNAPPVVTGQRSRGVTSTILTIPQMSNSVEYVSDSDGLNDSVLGQGQVRTHATEKDAEEV